MSEINEKMVDGSEIWVSWHSYAGIAVPYWVQMTFVRQKEPALPAILLEKQALATRRYGHG